MAKRGRPKFEATKKQVEAAYELAKRGCNHEEIANGIKVPYTTFRDNFRQFSAVIKKGREEGEEINIRNVENALLKRCIGFREKDVHISNYMGAITVTDIEKIYPPDPTSIFFYLVNRASGKWRSINKDHIDTSRPQTVSFEFEIVKDDEDKSED